MVNLIILDNNDRLKNNITNEMILKIIPLNTDSIIQKY